MASCLANTPGATMLLLALSLPFLAILVLVAASTYRHMRFGNATARAPFPFRYALACALVETFNMAITQSPLAQHRDRMSRMRAAEKRRQVALAAAIGRHPAGRLNGCTAEAATNPAENTSTDEFITRARAIHASDQVEASMAEALLIHPATKAAIARAKVAHPGALTRADVADLRAVAVQTAVTHARARAEAAARTLG